MFLLLESDSGGFSPRGFSLECNDANLREFQVGNICLNLIMYTVCKRT
jgi:hypothetical protein